MTNESEQPIERRVLKRGLKQIELRPAGNGRIEIVKRKRRHKFGEGTQPVGPERTLFRGMPEDACYVADVVNEVFGSDGE